MDEEKITLELTYEEYDQLKHFKSYCDGFNSNSGGGGSFLSSPSRIEYPYVKLLDNLCTRIKETLNPPEPKPEEPVEFDSEKVNALIKEESTLEPTPEPTAGKSPQDRIDEESKEEIYPEENNA